MGKKKEKNEVKKTRPEKIKDDNLERLYADFEKSKVESKEAQMRAKDIKEEIINIMNEKGIDELIIDGLDSLVMISITYPEREVLNKKALAEALNIKQKELSKPEIIIELTQQGLITKEMIEKYTEVEERMQFSAEEYDASGE